MDDDLKKLKKLTHFMKKEGILNVKMSNLEISLAPHAFSDPIEKIINPDKNDKDKIEEPKQYSEEEVLLWSAPGMELESESRHN